MKQNHRMTNGQKKLKRKKIVAGVIAFVLIGIMILGAITPFLMSF